MKNAKRKLIKQMLYLVVILVVSAALIVPIFQNLNYGLDLQGGFEVLYEVKGIDGAKVTNDMVTNTYRTLSRRIDEFGVSEPVITIEGDNKIRVQLAGIKDAQTARDNIGKVANLTFRDTDDNIIMTSDVLRAGRAKVTTDSYGKPAVALSIADNETFYRVTKKISSNSDTSKRMIVIWLDFEDGVNSYASESSSCGNLTTSRCLSAASVSQAFSGDVIIQGNFEQSEAEELVKLINSGSLPTRLQEISSKTVTASFGKDSLSKTLVAGVVGVALIMLFMIAIYHFAGFVSSVGLMVYTLATFAVFWTVGGTLTLPGIAALVIGIGMAVDANVISFSRIKDELYRGTKLNMAYKLGNKNSFSSIFDANFTTLIVAIILFIFGESSVKGFATMLIISIIVTMLIMVFLNRYLLSKLIQTGYFNDKLNLLIGTNKKRMEKEHSDAQKLHFVSLRKWFYSLSVIFLFVGVLSLAFQGLNLGIDFAGGSSITIGSETDMTEKTLKSDFKQLELEPYEITLIDHKNAVVNIKEELTKQDISNIDYYFTTKYNAKTDIGVVSNVVKKELVKNAIISVFIASIAIILYISFRFTFTYAAAAVIALFHDVLAIIVLFSLFHLEVSSIFIAAILSIIGYSINDTIVTFDRIRENIKKSKKKIKKQEQLMMIINESLASTLGRSIITTITTLIPVVALILLGSNEIVNFNLALLFGLIVGVYSSIFIASQLWFDMNRKHIQNIHKKKWYEEEIHEQEALQIKDINK